MTGAESFQYNRLAGMVGDKLRHDSTVTQENVNWKFNNILPSDFHLYMKPGSSLMVNDVVYDIGKLPANGSLQFAHNTFNDGDLLIVLFKHLDQKDLAAGYKNYQAMEPYSLRGFQKKINIGDVATSFTSTPSEYLSPYNALPGVWIHNRLLFPLNIYYGGKLVSQLGAYDGMTYMGGSRATIWFDNRRMGLDFEAPITLAYSLPESEGTSEYLYTVFLYDNKMRDIYVGVINANPDGPPPDTTNYSIDRPVHTGITFYPATGVGRSRETNPYGFFVY